MQYVTIPLKKHKYIHHEILVRKKDETMSPAQPEQQEQPPAIKPNMEAPKMKGFKVTYRSDKLSATRYSTVDFKKIKETKAPVTITEKASESPSEIPAQPEVKVLSPAPSEENPQVTKPGADIPSVPHTTNPAEELPQPKSKKELRIQAKEEKKAAKLAKKEAKRVSKMEKKLGREVTETLVSNSVSEDPKKKVKKAKKSDKNRDELKEKSKDSLKPVKKKFSLYDEVIDEEKAKLEKLDKMINQDGYYDALPTIDQSNRIEVKKKNNAKVGVLAALVGIAVVLVVILVALVASMF